MPLSKLRDKERKRLFRLDKRKENIGVQPKYVIYEGKKVEIPEIDADGNVMPGW